jgi:hypothetical protein
VTGEAGAPVARDRHGNPAPDGGAGEGQEAGFRTWGKSKDRRDDLPQVVIGMAVTRTASRCACAAGPGTRTTPP